MNSQGDCICRICNCGRHKCPSKQHVSGNWGPEVCSEYGHQFQSREICRSASCKPPTNPISSECPLSNVTTNRTDYVAHHVTPPQKMGPVPYESPTTPMNEQSVYSHEFTEKPYCAPRMIKPILEAKDNGKFESETTNRTDYIPHSVCAPEVRTREKYLPPTEPFDSINTYRSDYIEHSPGKVSSCKPPVTSMKSDTPFDYVSEQRHSYVGHQLEPRHVAAKAPYIKSDAHFDDMTTNRQDYIPRENCKAHSLKPPIHKVCSDQPFSSLTTNRADFVSHPTTPHENRNHETYTKPVGEMDLKTTYKDHYINQPTCKTMPIRQPQGQLNNEPFDGQTCYNSAYKNWNQPANIIQHRENYVPLDAPFDNQTTSRMAYTAHQIDRQPPCKPPVNAMESKPFDSQTSYRTDYVNRGIAPCPAAALTTNVRSISPDGYCYNGEDEEGHLHFIKPTTRIPIVA